MVVCEIAIGVMAFVVIMEIITRNLFDFSFEMSEELGGYIIVGYHLPQPAGVPGVSLLSPRAVHPEPIVAAAARDVASAVRPAVAGILRDADLAIDAVRAAIVALGRRGADVAGHAIVDSAVTHADRLGGCGRVAAALGRTQLAALSAMSVALALIGSFGLFLLLLAAGMAVPFAIAVPGVVYLLLQNGVTALKGIGLVTWGSMNSFTLTAIPLFVLMAELMQRSGLSFRIYRGLAKVVSRLPGGLLQTNIVGCALFAAISGSSVATAASIGGVALPQLVQRNYDRGSRPGRWPRAVRSASCCRPDRPDHLRFVHRDLGGQAVHGGRDPRPDADRHVHVVYRRALVLGPRGAARERRRGWRAAGACRHRAIRVADLRHYGQHLFRRGHADRGGFRRLSVRVAALPGVG